MEKFVQGQRLTASQLNNAFEKVGGPMNPSNDYQWTKTDYGNLQTTWNTFIQSKNQNPDTLEIGVGYSKIGSERVVEIDGKKPAALRRVFINVGPRMSMKFPGSEFHNCPNIGDVNGIPLLGVIGSEVHGVGNRIYLTGDGKLHFSVWSPALSEGTTPAQWAQNQKLYQNDVSRGCDSRNWWWTGITLERHDPSAQEQDEGLDICCFPMFLHYKDKSSEYPNWSQTSYAVLVVTLRSDLEGWVNPHPGFADALYAALTESFPVDDLVISEISLGNRAENIKCLGQYVYSPNTQNAYYKSNLRYVNFDPDTSPCHFASFIPLTSVYDIVAPVTYQLQWIDDKGKHMSKSSTSPTQVVHMDGTPLNPGDTVRHEALACGFNPKTMSQPILSCVAYDNAEVFSTGNQTQAILSGLFNEQDYGLSADMQKRLIWMHTLNSRGVEYYETCPDFRTGETPDSGISASCLSSIQEKDIELVSEEGQETQSQKLWSLWEFDNFENSKTYPEIQDNLSAYDLVVRHIDKRGEDTVGIVEYVHLSSLELSGCGNPPDTDVPASGTKSIETRTLTGGEKVIQLYDFDDGQAENVYLSAQGHYDFIVRDNDNHCVKYANLSGIGGEVTLSGTDGSSSTGSKWKFQAFANSNISVHISPQTIQIGCYYI